MDRQRLRGLIARALALLLRPLERTAHQGSPARVLVIKPDHLGDLLLLTPALRALRQGLPEARIAALIGPWGLPILRGNPDLDLLLTCPFPGFTRGSTGPAWQPYALLLKLGMLLRPGAFDVALIARDDHWWGALLAQAAGIPRRIGFGHPLVAPALTERLAWDPEDHVTRQGLALVSHLTGSQQNHAPLRFEPTAADQRWAERWIDEHELGGRPLVALHPGTAGPTKLWPAGRWAAVADALADRAEIALTVGPGEEALAHTIAGTMKTPPALLLGEATLGGLAALYARCDLLLGVDSLAGHLAISQGTPTVQLYGPSNQQRFGPWGDERNIVLRSGLWCSPCGVFERCPRGTFPAECMVMLGVDEVIAVARRQLGLERSSRWEQFSGSSGS